MLSVRILYVLTLYHYSNIRQLCMVLRYYVPPLLIRVDLCRCSISNLSMLLHFPTREINVWLTSQLSWNPLSIPTKNQWHVMKNPNSALTSPSGEAMSLLGLCLALVTLLLFFIEAWPETSHQPRDHRCLQYEASSHWGTWVHWPIDK